MTDDIIRNYPNKKKYISLPFRYTNDNFDVYLKIKNDTTIQNNYNKWKNCINYKTNRKIKIDGKVYNELKHDFEIKCFNKNVLFVEIDNINIEEYIKETENIKENISNHNNEINIYNIEIENIINKINKLNNWDEYIYFENLKFGKSNVIDDIHHTDNCFGNINKIGYEPCHCSTCENWQGCGKGGEYIYKCNKCNYKFTK